MHATPAQMPSPFSALGLKSRPVLAMVGDSNTYNLGGLWPLNSPLRLKGETSSTKTTNLTSAFVASQELTSGYLANDVATLTWDGARYLTASTAGGTSGVWGAGTPVDVTSGGHFVVYDAGGEEGGRGVMVRILKAGLVQGANSNTLTVAATPVWFHRGLALNGWCSGLFAGLGLDYWWDVRNFGIVGETPEGCASWGSKVLTVNPNLVIIQAGANVLASPQAGTPVTQSNHLIACAQVFIRQNIPVIIATPYYNTSNLSSQKNADGICELLRRWAASNPDLVRIFDLQELSTDPASANGAGLAAYIDTGLHCNCAFGLYAGAKLASQFPEIFGGPRRFLANSRAAIYDATYNVNGNRMGTLGMFAGTTGTLTAAGSTGTLGTGWAVTYLTNSYTSLALTAPDDGGPVARTDGITGKWQRIKGTTALVGAAKVRLLATLPNTIAAGKTFRVNMEYRLSDCVDLNFFQLKFFRIAGGDQQVVINMGSTSNVTITDTGTLVVSYLATAMAALDTMDFQIGTAVNGSFTLDLMNIEVRQVD